MPADRGPEVTVEAHERDHSDWEGFAASFDRVATNVEQVVQGKEREVRLALVCLIAEGHLLIEDVPGRRQDHAGEVIARSIDCSFRRIQFTPDLLPTDVTGVNVYNQERGDFEFKPGADLRQHRPRPTRSTGPVPRPSRRCWRAWRSARSRSTPSRTSSGTPFMVIATQNPIEHEGTYPLPEAQLDRFMMRLSIGYPTPRRRGRDPRHPRGRATLEDIEPVTDAPGVAEHDRAGA